ncbi:MAG: M13 family metallopeptidase, partial [Synergistaceae bacterium]|nr:M13 family metallopeptidase [Synergistaceae bacterium]
WDARNAELENNLKIIKNYLLKVEEIKDIKDLNAYFQSEECLMHGGFIANFSLGIDNDDSRYYNIELYPTGLSLGDSAEYKELSANGARDKKQSEAIALYMLNKLGYDKAQAEKIINNAFEFEKNIAEYMMTLNERNSPDAIKKLYANAIKLEDLKTLSPVFPFYEILAAHKVFSERINLQEFKWLDGLNKIYNNNNLENIKAYLIRNIASRYMGRLDENSYRELQKISRERNGIKQSKPDEYLAADFVHGRLPSAISKIYAEKYIAPETKAEVTQIINDAIAYYKEMLAGEDWLSEETKAKAIEKLEAITPRVAYPDKWEDYSKLDFKNLSYFNAIESLNKFNLQVNFYDKLNAKVDRERWVEDIAIVNAYYLPNHNEIQIIGGILSGDFYRPDMSYEEKLGGIGFVIGHELSHAFDTNGAQFDKNGSIKDWWTEQDYKTFKARADKLINYLNNIQVDGKAYNGALVQTETIADTAGIKAMLGIAAKHKDFDYDKFFRTAANIWKGVMTRERQDQLLKFDVHALYYLRVNAVLQQFDEFNKFYKLKPGDKMYLAPEDRALVW